MIALALGAWAGGWDVTVHPFDWEAGSCVQETFDVRWTGSEPVDLVLAAAPTSLDGLYPSFAPVLGVPSCPAVEGPRVELAPGGRASVPFVMPDGAWGRAGTLTLVVHNEAVGDVRIPVRVTVPEASTPRAFAARWEGPAWGAFAHPTFVEDLDRLAWQGVPWAAQTLAHLRGKPGVDARLAKLERHPLREIRAIVAATVRTREDMLRAVWGPGPDGEPWPSFDELAREGLLDGELAPDVAAVVGMPRLDSETVVRQALYADGSRRSKAIALLRHAPPLRSQVLRAELEKNLPAKDLLLLLPVTAPEDQPALLDALWVSPGHCEHAPLVELRELALQLGRRRPLADLLLACIASGEDGMARASLVNLVGWSRTPGLCRGDFDRQEVLQAWATLVERHADRLAAGHEIPTYAPGVEPAVRMLGCEVTPSVR